jgi:hypothetical protein
MWKKKNKYDLRNWMWIENDWNWLINVNKRRMDGRRCKKSGKMG